jgi:hypothetical protein
VNCEISAQKGFTIDNVIGLDLSGLTLNVKEGEAIIYSESK